MIPGGFHFRPLARTDFPLLASWLAQPHVARWWDDDPSPAALEADYGGCIDGTEPAQVFIASQDGMAIGLAQRYRLAAYPAYLVELAPLVAVPPHAASIDYLVGPPQVLRQGSGSALVHAFTQQLWRDDPPVQDILVPVHADNRASWRVLERAGYVRVARGELDPDNAADSRDHFIYRISRP